MEIVVVADFEEMSERAAADIITLLNEKPDSLISLAAGSTPTGTLNRLVEAQSQEKVDFSQAIFVGLDEWVGMDRTDEGSTQHYLYDTFFLPAQIREDQIFFFDAKAADLEQECQKIDRLIEEHSGLDLVLLGIGVNGHLGLNEPGVSLELTSHVMDLSETTKQVGQKYFAQETKLVRGITLGCQHFVDADKVILIANGEAKAKAVAGMVQGEITSDLPASVLQKHMNAIGYIDQAAASLLEQAQ